MKIKNIITSDIVSNLIGCTLILAPVISGIAYYTFDKQIEVSSENLNETFVDENGNICRYYDIGEHKITISRNDACYHKINSVDGYDIESVEVKGFVDNSKVTYVNKVPVLAIASNSNKEKASFDNFGKPYKKEKQYIR